MTWSANLITLIIINLITITASDKIYLSSPKSIRIIEGDLDRYLLLLLPKPELPGSLRDLSDSTTKRLLHNASCNEEQYLSHSFSIPTQ